VNTHASEVKKGERFEFGKNWRRFLSVLNDKRIDEAEKSLAAMLQVDTLEGRTFVDIGCGSGLFSLAARRLGADVTSFDFDPDSVACAEELRRRYFPSDDRWRISAGSALDAGFLESLGRFDVVYSWGVLHHTGHMWDALENVTGNVAPGGRLFISIYNDQGVKSGIWKRIKRIYCSGAAGKAAVSAVFIPLFVVYGAVRDLAGGRNPARRYREYSKKRGMSIYHDWFDWLGGYPFEVARPDEITEFYAARGFRLLKLVRAESLGTNQFVFQRPP
jgi:2-polyprenyl-6-hydroxyphenyl methylase/3-demethylubiquinone-9 3-methyltransferase